MTLSTWTNSTWLYIIHIFGIIITVELYINWNIWPMAQKIVAFTYMWLPFHVWEEWRIPGGFGWQYNLVMANSKTPERYPMNHFTDMITVFGAMCFGLAQLAVGAGPAILSLATIFAVAEVGMHTMFGCKMLQRLRRRGKRTIYNPGFATAISGFLALFIAGLKTLSGMNIECTDILNGACLLVIFACLTFLPERIIKSRDPIFNFGPGYYTKFL